MNLLDSRIIDVHCHIFPEKIAEKAVAAIGRYYNIKMFSSKGTVEQLLKSGEKIGVSKYLVHSTATKMEQVVPINNFIAETISKNKKFIGFGTLYPGLEDMDDEVDRMISIGLRGVKLHPEFQNFSLDDAGVMDIFRVIEGKLPALIHMGDENKDTSSPDKLAAILDKFPRLVVIAAHLGGYQMWNESIRYLVGKNVYFDTSSSLFKLDGPAAVEIIRRHGVEKVLFGTDYPMWGHVEELERFDKLSLTEKERKMILYENAVRLFNL